MCLAAAAVVFGIRVRPAPLRLEASVATLTAIRIRRMLFKI